MFKTGLQLSKNILKKLLGRFTLYPHLGSNTTDAGDVSIIKDWLKKTDQWHNEEPVNQYGREFANWNGSSYTVPFMGGRVALSAAIFALELEPGDEVIVPGYTCVVVPNAFLFANINVVYADIELDTYGLCARSTAEKIGPKTKAILIHHLYGLVCRDYEALLALAEKANLYVIEDCTQATGAKFKGKNVGNLGDIAIYSSEQSKCFNTGQGGMATTNNKTYAERMEQLKNKSPHMSDERIKKLLHTILYQYYAFIHPRRWLLKEWAYQTYGDSFLVSTTEGEISGAKPREYGAKMPAPLAVLGMNQLSKVNGFNENRRQKALIWDDWCRENDYRTPMVIADSEPVFLRYPVLVDPEKKQDLSWAEKELNIQPGVWFQTNIHPAAIVVEGCPNADKAVAGCINLPTLGF